MGKYEEAEGIRRSSLWLMNRSPYHFKYAQDHEGENRSEALTFGAAVHKYILEPDDFPNEYAVAPEVDRRTKAGKEIWAEFQAECDEGGKEAVTKADFGRMQAMAAAIHQNRLATQLLHGEHEREFYWTDNVSGEKCKCKCDCLTEYTGIPYIIDLKTTASCEDGHFERSCRDYGYDFQAGMYCEGVFQNTFEEYGFGFVAIEKTAPFGVRVYIADPSFIRQGKDRYRYLLDLYHECKTSDKWPSYDQGALQVSYVELFGGEVYRD